MLEGSLSGATDVPGFDREALLGALRTDRAGERYVPRVPRRHMAGVVHYDVDFTARNVT